MCEHDNIERCNYYYEEGRLVEYLERCTDCGVDVGVWAYGRYDSFLEGEEE